MPDTQKYKTQSQKKEKVPERRRNRGITFQDYLTFNTILPFFKK